MHRDEAVFCCTYSTYILISAAHFAFLTLSISPVLNSSQAMNNTETDRPWVASAWVTSSTPWVIAEAANG